MAESWWAATFRPPTFSELAYWTLVIAPQIFLLHFASRVRRLSRVLLSQGEGIFLEELPEDVRREWERITTRVMFREFGRLFTNAIGLSISLGFVILVQLLLVLVMILAIPPIGFLRSFARSVQDSVSATVGDSYTFVRSPLSQAAIFERVATDLNWLASRRKKVAIVAHSQGAAVTYLLFKHWDWLEQSRGTPRRPTHNINEVAPTNLVSVITFGSGIRKLWYLKEGPKVIGAIAAWIALAASLVLWGIIFSSIVLINGSVSLGGFLKWPPLSRQFPPKIRYKKSVVETQIIRCG